MLSWHFIGVYERLREEQAERRRIGELKKQYGYMECSLQIRAFLQAFGNVKTIPKILIFNAQCSMLNEFLFPRWATKIS